MPRGKKLNIGRIKNLIMLAVGGGIGSISAVTGISPQVSAAPTLQFLLGYQAEKALGTGIVFSLVTCMSAVVGISMAGLKFDAADALLTALGAFFGSLLVMKTSQNPALNRLRRVAQSIAMLSLIYVINQAIHTHIGGYPNPQWSLSERLLLLLIGLVCGALAQLFQISNGILLVPALIFLAGKETATAMMLALSVAAFAAFLPALAYRARGQVETSTGFWMILGGGLGAYAGSHLLVHWNRLHAAAVITDIPLLIFSLVAIYLCAWTAWRLT